MEGVVGTKVQAVMPAWHPGGRACDPDGGRDDAEVLQFRQTLAEFGLRLAIVERKAESACLHAGMGQQVAGLRRAEGRSLPDVDV